LKYYISHLEPFNICICSGQFAFKCNLLLLGRTDIHEGLGDRSRRLCRVNTHVQWRLDDNVCGGMGAAQTPPPQCGRKQLLPVIISLPELRTPSAWKQIVPASSLLRLDNVKACFFPRAVIRKFAPALNLAPSLVQEPSTSAWLSSTSNVTVSVSCALVSVSPFRTWIFFTEGRRRQCVNGQVRFRKCMSKHTSLENDVMDMDCGVLDM